MSAEVLFRRRRGGSRVIAEGRRARVVGVGAGLTSTEWDGWKQVDGEEGRPWSPREHGGHRLLVAARLKVHLHKMFPQVEKRALP